MKIKIILFTLLSIIICNKISAQDSTSYIYQRTYNRLKEKGLSNFEIRQSIREMDSLNDARYKKNIEEGQTQFEAQINFQKNNQTATINVCNDIPISEKNCLQMLYNQLQGQLPNNWNFSNQVKSYNDPSGGGWQGITLSADGCHIVRLSLINNFNSIPNLSGLSELEFLQISNDSNLWCPIDYQNICSLHNLKSLYIEKVDFGLNGNIPTEFNNPFFNANLLHLYLNDCHLNSMSQVFSAISNYTKIKELSLSKNFLVNGAFTLPNPPINLISNLTKLYCSYSNVNDISTLSVMTNLTDIAFNSNLLSQIPNLQNNHVLHYLELSDNMITGNIPLYFSNFSFYGLSLSYNMLSGHIPNMSFATNQDQFYFSNNFFRFNDFITDFNFYNNNIENFIYGPQGKTDTPYTTNTTIGQQVTLTMCVDGNYNSNDSYQWFKNNNAIIGATNREYIFTANASSNGVYYCRSYHFSPPMTNNSIYGNNLALIRNNITLNIIETPPPSPCIDCSSFDLDLGKKYIITGWVNAMKDNGSGSYDKLNIYNYEKAKIAVSFLNVGGTVIGSQLIFDTSGEIIDGWQKIYGEFVVPNNIDDLKIDLVNDYDGSIVTFFDDIRVHPFDGNMKSFVYNQENQKLMAELDENNYATFYEYDKEGGLVRVKKETEKGVFTIQETRSSTTRKH